ncbi:trypco2 family protein [Streptomyces sp. RFCAC02]|uniref:trypco2 family protein n=1 Tax=Streptomyces sp. RFCAC02 TaxID=2499143 RepID=UPI001F0EAB71|nr:trypco2 family protein [Streptomyces sp. RFCAC02]
MGTSGGDPEIGLAAALGAIRRELGQAMAAAEAEAGPVRLAVSSLELELQTTLTRTGDLDGGIRVHVISAGSRRSESRSDVQVLRLQLDARTAAGGPVATNDTLSRPPR